MPFPCCAAAFLSGAGPSVMALLPPTANAHAVAACMLAAAESVGVSGHVIQTSPTSLCSHASTVIPVPAYVSTRDASRTSHTFRFVAMEGLAKDGGLYVPVQVLLVLLLLIQRHCFGLM